MDPQDVSSTPAQQRSECDGRARPVLRQTRDFCEKRFARNADDQRATFKFHVANVGECAAEGKVLRIQPGGVFIVALERVLAS